MNRYSNEIKVGITIIAAILVAFVGFRILQDIPFFGRTFSLHTYYERVDGISPGATVYMSGVKVGSVRQVQLVGDSVRVDMGFSDLEGIPKGSLAVIEATDLLGTRAIVIRKSTQPEFIEDGGYIKGEFDEGIAGQFRQYGDEIVPKISESTEHIGSFMAELDMLLKDGGRQNLDGIFANLNRTTTNIDRLVEEKHSELAESVDRFNSILANVDTLSADRKEQVDTVLVNLEETTEEMKQLTRELNQLSAGLNETVYKLNHGEGSLGRMLNDPSLYNNLDSLAYGLNNAVKKLNEDPRHFLKHMRLVDIF